MRTLLCCMCLLGCQSYQRNPNYLRARLWEVICDPLQHDNVKYTVIAAMGTLVLLAIGFAVSRGRGPET